MSYPPSDPNKVNLGFGPSLTTVYYEALFTEAGAGTYKASFPIPAGATVLKVLIANQALWSAATSAALKVGDTADDDCFTNATTVNVKTTPAVDDDELEGTSSDYVMAGKTKRYPNGDTLVAQITSVGAGATGQTTVGCLIAVPSYEVAVVKS